MQKFEQIFQKEIEIVNILNLLTEDKYNYYSKLEIQEDEKLIIFGLVKNEKKLKFLEQSEMKATIILKQYLL